MADWFKKKSGRYINLDWVVNAGVEETPYVVFHDGRSIVLDEDEADRLRRRLDAAAEAIGGLLDAGGSGR